MAKEVIVAGLDLGSSSVKCVIGVRHSDGIIDIIGTGFHESAGLASGAAFDRSQMIKAISQAIDEAEMMAGCDIKNVHIAIVGDHVRSFNSTGIVRIRSGQVTDQDVAHVIDTAEAVRIPVDRAILHTIPQEYVIDGQGGIRQPQGMSGVRLEVRAHLVTGSLVSARDLVTCCQSKGLKVVDVVFAPLAAASALLGPHDRELGVAIVDIGGSSTDIAVFQKTALVFSQVIGIGGEHITADIRDCLHTPTEQAEALKTTHGCAMASLVANHEEIEIPGVGGRKPRMIKRSLLCEIVEARVAEIFTMITETLEQAGFDEGLPAGVVLTGGTSNMVGITELSEEILGMPSAPGQLRTVSGLVDIVKNPRYGTGTGLVVCGANQSSREWFSPASHVQNISFWDRVWGSMPWSR